MLKTKENICAKGRMCNQRGLECGCAVAYRPVVAYPSLGGPVLSRQRHIARRSVRQQGSAERPTRRVGDIVRSPEAVECPRIRLARRHDIVRSELAVTVGLRLGGRARNAQIARIGRCWRSSLRWRRPRRHIPRWCCLLYTSPSPRDRQKSRMPSSA